MLENATSDEILHFCFCNFTLRVAGFLGNEQHDASTRRRSGVPSKKRKKKGKENGKKTRERDTAQSNLFCNSRFKIQNISKLLISRILMTRVFES